MVKRVLLCCESGCEWFFEGVCVSRRLRADTSRVFAGLGNFFCFLGKLLENWLKFLSFLGQGLVCVVKECCS